MRNDTGARTALAAAPGPVLGSDPHDFAGLYIRHRSSFTSHARRYLRDPRDADEVVQEAFLRLFLAMPELETELQALAYCRRTITNLCIDRYRADARRPRLVALEGAPVEDLVEDDTGDPVVRAEDAALVREALSKLPELHRAALVMREIEEKPLPVIADELDVPEDSVKHLLFRARRGLRKLLAGTSVAPGVDAERTRGLRPLARGASGGVAGLVLLALLGLGSGPDLRAVPVVGVDLPDVLGVTAVADAVRDAVGAIVARSETDAAALRLPGGQAEGSPTSADRSAPTLADEPASGPTGTTAGARAAGRDPGAQPGQPVSGPSVVDGVPVVRLLPPLSPAGPVADGRPSLPGSSAGRGPLLPAGLPPQADDAGRAAPAPGESLVAEQLGRLSGPVGSGRSLRAGDAAQEADELAAKAADSAGRAASRTAERAADVAEKAQERADRGAEKLAAELDKTIETAAKAAERAADKAAQAAVKADRAAQQAAQKAAQRAAEQAAVRAAEEAAARAAAERAAARAAELAAAQAAERAAAAAAAAAAAVAAEQAAASAVEVSAPAPTAVPVLAP